MSERKARRMSRREALKSVGASSLVPLVNHLEASRILPGSAHPLVPLQDDESFWKPAVLDSGEIETVIAISEKIIPETDTPGARMAGVHQYIDYMLSQEDERDQETFVRGLAWLDQRSQDLFGAPFVGLDEEQQDSLLSRISSAEGGEDKQLGGRFFDAIKQRTVEGYYTSEVGMVEELGYKGSTYLAQFEGCQHPKHHERGLG